MDQNIENTLEENDDFLNSKRDRGYLRHVKEKKIKKRKQMVKNSCPNWAFLIKQTIETKRKYKFDEAIFGNKEGLLSKEGYGFINGGSSVKTNTRKGHAGYRHKGDYGKANNYKKHDQQQIDKFMFDLDELN